MLITAIIVSGKSAVPIIQAVLNNDLEKLEELSLTENFTYPDSTMDHHYLTPLHVAAILDNVEAAKMLVDKYSKTSIAFLGSGTVRHRNPLQLAAEYNSRNVIDELIQEANITCAFFTSNYNGHTRFYAHQLVPYDVPQHDGLVECYEKEKMRWY